MPRPAPVAPTPQRANHREPHPKDDTRPAQIYPSRWREGKRRVLSPRPRSVDNGGIVVRYVNEVGTHRLHDDLVVLIPDSLLGCRFQCACGDGEFPQSLNRIHHVALLGEKGVADLLGPLQIALHHSQGVRKGHERLYAQVPVLMLQGSRERVASQCGVGLVFQPVCSFDDFERIGRGREDLGDEGVRVEGDRRRE